LAFATSSFGGYGLALAALALVVFGVIECPPHGRKGFVIPTKSFVKIGITKIIC